MIWIKRIILQFISTIKKFILGKFAEAILYKDKSNFFYLVDVDDMVVGRKLAYDGINESQMIQDVNGFINEQSTVVILGTHVGTLLIPLSTKVKSIYGFEANPTTFKLLEMNLLLNNIKNAQIYNVAIGNKSGQIDFYANKLNSGGSKIKPENDSFYKRFDLPNTIQVEVTPLDSYFHKYETIDLLLVDIEGGEYNALKGMTNTLKKVSVLQIEYVPRHLKYISNVDNKEFFSLIMPYFKRFKIVDSLPVYDIDQIFGILDSYWKNNLGCDIIFFK
ncbi:FkbM family methyltransferase [Emticicia sp. W12TSBA100-4]|uniref:FkbM family methyltransferase n=1 Tax=Emticicia sp. W12TSBA100-4 TaxID=3160965 RepID=UPI003305BD01